MKKNWINAILLTLKKYIFNALGKVGRPDVGMSHWDVMRFCILYIGKQNIVKAYKIQSGNKQGDVVCSEKIYSELDFFKILLIQNELSADSEKGKIWILNCCMTLLGEYKFFWKEMKLNQEP